MSGKNEDNPQVQNEIESKQEKCQKPKRRIYRKRNQKPEIVMQPEINDPEYYWTDQEDFIVERIIREEVWDNKRYYLVKWKGFDITMSTWEEVQKFKHMQDLIDSFNRSQKGKRDRSIQESCNAMMNPYRATQIHGHFLYGDEPNQIANTFVEYSLEGKKTIYLEVSWKNRKVSQGYLQLENSILSSDTVFEHNPQFLLQFYKKNVALRPQN